MAKVYKVLGQVQPTDTNPADAYSVPAVTQAIVSSVLICNQGAATTYRLWVSVAAAADNVKQYLAFDVAIAANDVHDFTIGATLGPADVVRVLAGTADRLSFNVFGEEIS